MSNISKRNFKKILYIPLIVTTVFLLVWGLVYLVGLERIFGPEAIISNQILLQECLNRFGSSQQRAHYMNINPGITTMGNLPNLVGEPIQRGILNYWEYEDFTVTFNNSAVVNEIIVSGDSVPYSFEEILDQYGCPDSIFLYDPSEDAPNQNWQVVSMGYLDNGFELIFEKGPPIKISSDIPQSIIYFAPMSVSDYMQRIEPAGSNFHSRKLASWEDAVIP